MVWLKDGSELRFGQAFPGRRKISTMQPPNRLVSTVQFESMSFADNGQYVCYIPGASKNLLINIEGLWTVPLLTLIYERLLNENVPSFLCLKELLVNTPVWCVCVWGCVGVGRHEGTATLTLQIINSYSFLHPRSPSSPAGSNRDTNH